MKKSVKKEWIRFISMFSVSVIAAVFGFGYFWLCRLLNTDLSVFVSIFAGLAASGMLGYLLRGDSRK